MGRSHNTYNLGRAGETRAGRAKAVERVRRGGSRVEGHETVERVQERADRPKKVLFVCRANVCRSPMAEALFNALVEEKPGLRWRAESAGVAALTGEDITPKARAALEEVGIYAEGHRVRQVTEAMLEGSGLVLVMSPRQVAALHREFGGLLGKSTSCRSTRWAPPTGRESRTPTGRR